MTESNLLNSDDWKTTPIWIDVPTKDIQYDPALAWVPIHEVLDKAEVTNANG